MSKDRKKVVHIHSNVNDKQPTPATLELGELGVNNAAGNAFISTKNSNDEVVRFSEDGTIVNWMEYKEVIPYEAYVRGSNSATTDVTVDDLANNKSNIVIKLNQVVARNTEYDEKVNGAKDIYGNEINPISADGYKDGAGLAIDMSRYAMIGANPSFSSITTTYGANLRGSELDINVNIIKESATTIDTTACTRNYNNTNDFKVVECTEGQGEAQINSSKKFNVKSNDIVLEQYGSDGETRIKSCSAITLQSKNIIMTDTDCGDGEVTFDINDLCLVGRTKMNIYGSETNFGIDCDDNTVAQNTNVYGNEILVSANTGSIIEAAKDDVCITAGDIASIYGETNTKIGITCDGSAKTSNLTFGGDVICLDSDDRANVYGTNKSDLGINCGDNDRSTVTRVHGDTVNVTGGTVNVNSETAINTTAATNLCEKGENSYFYGTKVTHIGQGCDGTKSSDSIIYERIPSASIYGIKASTVDGALDEVLDRNKIHYSKVEGTHSTTHVIWQDSGATENKIEFTTKETVVSMSSTTEPSDSDALKTYTLWQEIGEEVVPIGDINVPTCVNHLNRHMIKFQSGSTSTFDNQIYDPGKDCANSAETINIPTTISHLNRGNLTYTHNGFSGTFDPATDTEFTSPHSSLTISYGSTYALTSTGITYDTSADRSIVVPKTISDVTGGKIEADYDSECISVSGNVCVDGVVKANALYSTSDERLKENIYGISYDDYIKASNVSLKSFNFKDDETKTKTYGVIAQHLQNAGLNNIVHKDDKGNLSVDYISFLILRIASLENTIRQLSKEIENLKKG